ncbi:MAG: DUF1211 domain-containing protein [Anaerolineae bacterium]|nr:DUF1211 domain-containing protein [Anaerolineae bacterium]
MTDEMSSEKPAQTNTKQKRSATFYTDKIGLERLIFFSDAVFAIAITLLALEIRLPEEAGQYGDLEMWAALVGLWHQYLAYIISFLVIGSFWMAHHRKFRLVDRYDNRLLSLNLLVLMSIAFIPFASSVISVSSTRSATIFYALTMVVVSLFFTAMWVYITHDNRLLKPDISQQRKQREFISVLSTVVVFLISIVLSFINTDLARLSWILILPAGIYVNTKTPTT